MNNIEHVRLLNSNKFTLKEKRLLFIGILSDTICNRSLFKRNDDLKEYIRFYEKILNVEPYKDYLYASRPLLISRLVKDFIGVDDTFIIKECFKLHIHFIEHNEEFKGSSKETKSKNNNLLTDMINRGKNNE